MARWLDTQPTGHVEETTGYALNFTQCGLSAWCPALLGSVLWYMYRPGLCHCTALMVPRWPGYLSSACTHRVTGRMLYAAQAAGRRREAHGRAGADAVARAAAGLHGGVRGRRGPCAAGNQSQPRGGGAAVDASGGADGQSGAVRGRAIRRAAGADWTGCWCVSYAIEVGNYTALV
jgi:hypothetical protein